VNLHGLLKTTVVCVALVLTGHAANGAEVDLRTSTYLHFYQVDQLLGPDTSHAPLYQYLSLDVREANSPDLSFHLYGWGRLDLQEETDPDMSQGHLSSAHARYRHREGQGQVRAGRIFITEGTAMEALDGVYLKESFNGFGVALFGGVPNGDDDAEIDRGDTLAGTRVWIAVPGRIETGLNYLYEDGDFEGDKRQEAGLDLWLQPTGGTFVTGKLLYNLSTSDLASGDLTMFFQPGDNVDLSLAGASYKYHDLFQSVVNPAFSDSALDPDDEVTTISGSVEWRSSKLLTLLGSAKMINHKLDDPGGVIRTEAGFDLALGGDVSIAGLRLANQSGDLAENEYNDLRGFTMFSFGRLAFALDALLTAYEEDVAGVLRLEYGHGVGSGVYR